MSTTTVETTFDVEDRYQNWVYRHPVGGAAVAAFIATQVGTIWGYYAKGIGLPSLPFPNYNGALFAPASVAKDFSNFGNTGSFFVGQSLHMINGIVFGMMFALVAYKTLPTFFPKMKSVQKGLVFGVVQTIISIGFLFHTSTPRRVDSVSSASALMRSAPTPITGSCPSPFSCGI